MNVYVYEPPNEWHPGIWREHLLDPDDPDMTICGETEFTGTLDESVFLTHDCRTCLRDAR